jgi:plasmid maintenance system antidote protein VapI
MRIPSKRPPTRPGEMLLEEFIKPLGMSQTELAEWIWELYQARHSKTAAEIKRIQRHPAIAAIA